MENIILLVHVSIAIALIAFVLLQQGKGADMGAAFGSGASQTVFGSRGSSSFLTRATAGLATAFFATSLTLAYFSVQSGVGESVMDRVDSPATSNMVDEIAIPKDDEIPAVPTIENNETPLLPEEIGFTSPVVPEFSDEIPQPEPPMPE